MSISLDKKLKRDFIYKYLMLMVIIFFVHLMIYTFIHYNKFLIYYISGGLLLTTVVYFLVKRSSNVDKLVRYYLILSPIYIISIIIYLWNVTSMSLVWLLPLPLGVYIFFPNKKYIIVFALYSLMVIMIKYLIIHFFKFSPEISRQSIILTDTLSIVSNLLIILLEIYYYDRIRKVEFFLQFEKKHIVKPYTANCESHHLLFDKIEKIVKDKKLYKDEKFNISKLCAELDVNNKYIAKALRTNNYINFNNYLNFHRINYVKKLIKECNLEKVTLMYIYTEAGFSNQSTFNRVFKQFENMTPSEYIANSKCTFNIMQ